MSVNTYKRLLLVLFGVWINTATSQQEKSQAGTYTLQQCIDTALVNSTQVQIAGNNRLAAEVKHKEVVAGLIPKLTASGEYKYFIDLPYQLMPAQIFGGPPGVYKEVQFGVPHNINANVTLQLPLYAPQLYGGMKQTALAAGMANTQLRKTKEQIYYDVTLLYRNAQLLINRIAFLDTSIANTNKILDNVRQLQAQQLTTETDVKRVALQLSVLNSQKAKIEAKVEQILNALKIYMGKPFDFDLQIVSEIESATEQPAEYTKSITADEELLDFKQQLIKSKISTLRKSKFLPQVGAFGYLGTTGFGYDGAPKSFLNFYPVNMVGLKISMPLFNGTVTNKQIAREKLEYQNVLLQQQAVKNKSDLEITNARNDLLIARQMLEVRQNEINLANDIYRDTYRQHQQALVSTTDLIKAENELRNAKQNYLSAMVDYLIADLKLKQLTGNILK